MSTTTAIAARSAPASAPASSARNLLHLDGFRSFASLFVLLEHYCEGPHGDLAFLFSRANVMVCYYIVLSGHVTAYAYGDREFACSWRYDASRASYFVKRFLRVALSYYSGFCVDWLVSSVGWARPAPLGATAWLQLFMANELGLKYKRVKPLSTRANFPQSILQRQ